MAEKTAEGMEKSFGPESKSERQSPFIKRVVTPLAKRFGPFVAPFILTVAAACSEGGESLPSQEISQPPTTTPAATQTIEAQPTIKATVRPATVTPTASPTGESPKPAAGAEKPAPPKGNWVVEVDPKIEGQSFKNRSIEENKAIVEGVISKLPLVTKVKIVLTAGKGSHFDNETQTAFVGVETEKDEFIWHVAHESFHSLDPVENQGALLAVLGAEKLAKLAVLREQALADPFWGRDYPSVERIFDPAKWQVKGKTSPSNLLVPLSRQELAALTSLYPDSVWIAQKRLDQQPRNSPFSSLISNELKTIESYARETKETVDFVTISQFMAGEKEKLDRLAADNPILAKALELILEKKQVFSFPQILWSSAAPVKSKLWGGENLADWWRALPAYMDLVLAEALLTKRADVIVLFPQDKLGRINSILRVNQGEADDEKLAELATATILFGVETSFSPILAELRGN